VSNYDLTVLSLGAGTQSSALLMLAIEGKLPEDVPPLDAAIFADTGEEPQAVYAWLDVLENKCIDAGIDFYRLEPEVSLGDSATEMPDGEKSRSELRNLLTIPTYVVHDDGKKGLTQRRCTDRYKIVPIRRKVNELVGGKPRGKKVLQLIGLSENEVGRVKPSGVKYIENRYPLIEMGWQRNDSIRYIESLGLGTPPRSACVFCPFNSDEAWEKIKENEEDWQRAIEVDERLRASAKAWHEEDSTIPPNLFVHRSGLPLADVRLQTKASAGVVPLFDEFSDECSGMCGV
jgi:hypothetical protein